VISKKTVFVLGAGASWHYGYPTGEGLISEVIAAADVVDKYCSDRCNRQAIVFVPELVKYYSNGRDIQGAWRKISDDCKSLSDRLKTVHPLLIDHFLAWNTSLSDIGKFMIAAVIMRCESRWLNSDPNINREIDSNKDNWYRFLVHKLAYGCERGQDLLLNNVKFITFNYDSSLELCLLKSLSSIDLFNSKKLIYEFLENDRICHVYGAARRHVIEDRHLEFGLFSNLKKLLSLQGNSISEHVDFFDICWQAAQNLRSIDPHEKVGDGHSIKTAQSWMADAEVIYILGFGFDENNNRRIGLDKLKNRKNASILFTNFENRSTINKKASDLFVELDDFFIDRATYHQGSYYVEKSVKSVYEAFELDFDEPESDPRLAKTI
jgi:hypothetical protein